MPPGRPPGSGNKAKSATFKPPRPASKPSTKTNPPPRRISAPSLVPQSLTSSEDEDREDADELSQASAPQARTTPTATHDAPPTIPPKLLTKLLHHHFADEKTRLSKDANAIVGKYMETFVREALARAAFERREVGGGDFLEVGSYGLMCGCGWEERMC